jgi:mono/diheme cytochrome c family protein
MSRLRFLGLCFCFLLACKAAGTEETAAQRGRKVYAMNCMACHNSDPTRDGVLGPAVAGASRELIEARVLRGEYPPGHTPKRATKTMPPLPHLGPAIDDLAAYLKAPPP